MRTPILRACVLALILVVSAATPAAADAAGPSDFRSEVTGITPAIDGIQAEIRGGDSFLELEVDEGTEVVVYGYEGAGVKPYLRFNADGTVERNRTSPATYINDDRMGGGDIPAQAQDESAEPDWEQVADGGSYAWHDHRVHWMQDASPPVERGERVEGAYDPWRVPIEVDGTPADIEGTLTYEEATSPLPWLALAVGAAALLAWGGRRRPVRGAAAALTATSALAIVVGRADFASTPDGGGDQLAWILPIAALALAAAALVRPKGSLGVVAALGSVATLSGWALLRLDVLAKPVLPTELAAPLDRASVAAAIGVSVAAAYLAVTSGAFKLPELTDDDPGERARASRPA